jgi:hypothetical protein
MKEVLIMTDEQKTRIFRMREQGMSYDAIAEVPLPFQEYRQVLLPQKRLRRKACPGAENR